MKADLQELQITQEELEKLIGVENIPVQNSCCKKVLKFIGDVMSFIGTLTFLGCICALIFIGIIPRIIFLMLLSIVMIGIGAKIPENIEDSAKSNADKSYQINYKSSNIAEELNKYNQLVKNIAVVEQLQEIGHDVKLDDRHKVIEAFQLTRDDLIRALKTERILRENPDFSPEKFAINLTTIKTLQAAEQASEYGQLLNEALQVGISVQEEMRKLQSQSKGKINLSYRE